MSERRLAREDIHSSLYRVRGMAVPQLVWVDVKPCCPAPLATDQKARDFLLHSLVGAMSIQDGVTHGTRR